MKDFYKQQKKKGAGASKPGKSSGGASVGAGNPPQPPALVAHGSLDLIEEYGEEEAKLRQFDMDMRFGPCIGMTRLRRWERAVSMGLDPPADVGRILRSARPDSKAVGLECLWDGRV